MMTLYPEYARRAQREIDSVLGMNRLPTLEDRDDLPYLDCIIQEVYRCVDRLESPFSDVLTIYYDRWDPPLPLGRTTFVAHGV